MKRKSLIDKKLIDKYNSSVKKRVEDSIGLSEKAKTTTLRS